MEREKGREQGKGREEERQEERQREGKEKGKGKKGIGREGLIFFPREKLDFGEEGKGKGFFFCRYRHIQGGKGVAAPPTYFQKGNQKRRKRGEKGKR